MYIIRGNYENVCNKKFYKIYKRKMNFWNIEFVYIEFRGSRKVG